MQKATWFSLMILLPFMLMGQRKIGIKVGLNISSLKGPQLSVDSTSEQFSNITGFHIGPSIQWPLTTTFGIKTELLYNQAGTKYKFEGEGFHVFRADDGTKIVAEGSKQLTLNIVNTYLDLPVLAYGRVGSFQLEGGLSLGWLISSIGDGQLIFSGVTEGGTIVPEIKQTLFYNFLRDKAGDADFSDAVEMILDGKPVQIPSRLKAYYFDDERHRMFKPLDVRATIGASYYFNKALFFSTRVNFGLSDVTNNEGDFNPSQLNGKDLIRSLDKDKNFQIQISLGFNM